MGWFIFSWWSIVWIHVHNTSVQTWRYHPRNVPTWHRFGHGYDSNTPYMTWGVTEWRPMSSYKFHQRLLWLLVSSIGSHNRSSAGASVGKTTLGVVFFHREYITLTVIVLGFRALISWCSHALVKETMRVQGTRTTVLGTQVARSHMNFRVQAVSGGKSTEKITSVSLSQSLWDCSFSNWFEEDGLGRARSTDVFAHISESIFA